MDNLFPIFFLGVGVLFFGGGTFYYLWLKINTSQNRQQKLQKKVRILEQVIAKLAHKQVDLEKVQKKKMATFEEENDLASIIKQMIAHFKINKNKLREIIIVQDDGFSGVDKSDVASHEMAVILDEARELVKRTGVAAISLLVKKLNISKKDANLILDWLEEEGIIGPADGTSHRPVFIRE